MKLLVVLFLVILKISLYDVTFVYEYVFNTSEYLWIPFFCSVFVSDLKVSEINKVIPTQTVLGLYNQKDSKDICNLGLQLHNCISSNVRESEF